jgi:alkane 1-monooxygenase
MAGVNGLAGHELIHKKSALDKAIGMITYTKILYSHFLLEHSSGHHRNVATSEDPATAKKGEDFYSFAVRSAVGGHINTYNREYSRLQTKYGCEHVSILKQIFENRMTWFGVLHAALMLTIYALFGIRGVFFQLSYSLVGIFFIELINYTEHYGLERKKDARGIYEPITEQHSWNAPSSPLLFRIQRHSDHHMHAYRPYQILRKIDNAPTMPYMYLYTLLLALCPPLWFDAMDQLLENNEHKREINAIAFFICVLGIFAYSSYLFI